MEKLKVASWNIEWMSKLWPNLAASKFHIDRRQLIADEIRGINADVFCVGEGVASPTDMQEYVTDFLPEYDVITRPENESWGLRGQQWIYFLVKKESVANPYLVPIKEWYDKTPRSWPVHFNGSLKTVQHSHYRLPQVLRFSWQEQEIELIGCHMKSKINFNAPFQKGTKQWKQKFIDDALKARTKLATEAISIRKYIDARFKEEENPAIMIMGDFNDGVGKERIEREFMFFDLISVLQGDVFFSKKFLNHALFDYPQDLRWTTKFKDKTDPERDPHILLDHILFTQAFVNNSLDIEIVPKAGKVEHVVHNRVNAGLSHKKITSDHRPVSIEIQRKGHL